MTAAARALTFAMLIAAGAAQAQDATGAWLNQDKDGMVQIGDCGALRGRSASGALCGKVIWIRDAIDKATGRPPVDARNTDPALRTRPIMGLTVLSDLKPAGTPGRWDGRVYNIDDGKTYNARVTLVGANGLKVEGCVMMLCQGETWTRQAPPTR
jgi:uncharacterized protein (DUF2147 family)